MPGCIGHNKEVTGLEVQPMGTPTRGQAISDRPGVVRFGIDCDPLFDVRLPVCQPLEVTTSMVDPIMSNDDSRVKLGLHAALKKLNMPKTLKVSKARVYRRLKKRKPRMDPCNCNDTTSIEVNVANTS
jgi:hypothetical protein